MYWTIGIVAGIAVLDWLTITQNWGRIKYYTKPGVMVALLLWFYCMTGFRGEGVLFALALLFSLIGDIWLMLPGNYFLRGLVAFFLAHCAYIGAFNPTLPTSSSVRVILLVVMLIVIVFFFTQIRAGMVRKRGARILRIMSGIYSLVLGLMTVSTITTLTRPEWVPAYAIQAAAGGVLFFASDSLLAYDRFVRPISNGRLAVRITYHLGQILIISGAALQIVHAR